MSSLDATFDVPIDLETAADAERLFEEHAGVRVETLAELEQEIVSDLDPLVCGVGWWAASLGDKRRIFVSDYLVQCLRSVRTNMVESALHLLEAQAAHSRDSEKMAHVVAMRPSGQGSYEFGAFNVPQQTSLRDLVHRKLSDLHIAGFLRSIGSVLDTLAGLIIGVGAFRLKIVRADFEQLRKHLDKPLLQSPGVLWQQAIKEVIVDAVAKAGPDGWLEWALQYRNTLVHRGRRIQYCHVVRDEGPVLFSASEVPMPRTKVVLHLARDPGNSDLQALFGSEQQPNRLTNVLEEDAFHTLSQTMLAAKVLVEETTRVLVDVWKARRDAPSILLQPVEQWPDVAIQPDRFFGFAPGSVPVKTDAAIGSPANIARLEAAAISSTQRHRWLAFTS